MGRANVGKQQASLSDSYLNNVVPAYTAVVYKWGSLCLAEDREGSRLTSGSNTDAGNAIQKAVNYCSDVGGGIIYQHPTGTTNTYNWTTNVTWASGVNWIGGGDINTINSMAGKTVDFGSSLMHNVEKLRFIGNGTGTCFDVGGDSNSALHTWKDLTFGNPPTGTSQGFATAFNCDTQGVYDQALYNVKFYNNDVAYDYCTSGDQTLFSRCQWRLNGTAVKMSGSSEQNPTYEACTFSGNDYDFDITSGAENQVNLNGCWFENEGARSLGAGSGNMFLATATTGKTIRPWNFNGCRIGGTTKIDLGWIEATDISYVDLFHFIGCSFTNWDNMTNFQNLTNSLHPTIVESNRQDTLFAKHRVRTNNNVISAAFAVDAVASLDVDIAHGCAFVPLLRECACFLIQDTAVDDYTIAWMRVKAADATNVTVRVRVSAASGTGGATAKIGVRIGDLK